MKKLLVGLFIFGSVASHASIANNGSGSEDIKKALRLYFLTKKLDCSITLNEYGASVKASKTGELIHILKSTGSTIKVSSDQRKVTLALTTGYPANKQNIIDFALNDEKQEVLKVERTVKEILSSEINNGTIVNPNFSNEVKTRTTYTESCDVVENL